MTDTGFPPSGRPNYPSSSGNDDSYDGNGSYYDNSNTGGRRGADTPPPRYDSEAKAALKIVKIIDKYYWEVMDINFLRLDNPYKVIVYYVKNVDLNDPDSVADAQNRGISVWEIDINPEKAKFSYYRKLISDTYYDGYFYLRTLYHNKYSNPTPLVKFPEEADFIIPNQIRDFTIEEDGYFPSGYTKPVSRVTINYVPPEDLTGFYGVKLFVKGYAGDNNLREVAVQKYDKYNPELNTFEVYLEPYVLAKQENCLTGVDDMRECEEDMVEPDNVSLYFPRSEDTDISVTPMHNGLGINPNRKFSTYVNKGDIVVARYNYRDPDDYINPVFMGYAEAEVLEVDTFMPSCEKLIVRKICEVTLPPNLGKRFARGVFYDWGIYESVTFYLCAINASGYHADPELYGLSMNVLLDGIDSAPAIVISSKAIQFSNKNVVRWRYNNNTGYYPSDNIEHFNVYRTYFTTQYFWEKIGTVKTTSYNSNNSDMEPYQYDDCNPSSGLGTLNYDGVIKYAVSAVDCEGKESLIKEVARYYLIDGTYNTEGIPFRRDVGKEIAVRVLTRGYGGGNLLWNTTFDWGNSVFDTEQYKQKIGDPFLYDWSMESDIEEKTLYYIAGSNSYFYITNSSIDEAMKYAHKLACWNDEANGVLQPDTLYVASDTHDPNGSNHTCVNLGRAYLEIIPLNVRIPIFSVKVSSGSNLVSFNHTTAGIYNPFAISTTDTSFSQYTWRVYGNMFYYNPYQLPEPDFYNYVVPSYVGDGVRSSLYVNGWDFLEDTWLNTYLRPAYNGVLPIHLNAVSGEVPPLTRSANQRIRMSSWFFSGQKVTLSFMAGLRCNTSGAPRPNGVLDVRIRYKTGPVGSRFALAPMGETEAQEISLDNIPYVTGNVSPAYEYYVVYLSLDNVPEDTSCLEVSLTLEITQSVQQSYHYILFISQLMFNLGNEALPWDPNVAIDPTQNKFNNTTPPVFPPENPDPFDPSCVATGQYITTGDGRKVLVDNLKERDVLKGFGSNVLVTALSRRENVKTKIITIGDKTIEVSCSHNCVIFNNGYAELRKAAYIRVGDDMLDESGDIKKVISIENGKNTVYKISTTFPNYFYVNGILNHNMKKGEQ